MGLTGPGPLVAERLISFSTEAAVSAAVNYLDSGCPVCHQRRNGGLVGVRDASL